MGGNGRQVAEVADPPVEPVHESALRSLLPHLFGLFRREPALGITVAYLLVAMVGLFYADRFYARFDIPVLGLLQIGDFLAAGVQKPVALLLVLSTLPIIWAFDWINVHSRRRYRRAFARLGAIERPSWPQRLRRRWLAWQLNRGHWYMRLVYAAVLVGYGWLFVAFYADDRVRRIEQGRAQEVRVWMNGGQALPTSDGGAWRYLGAVSNYVFVYDGASRRSQILPVQSVGRIEPVAAAPAAKAPLVVPIP